MTLSSPSPEPSAPAQGCLLVLAGEARGALFRLHLPRAVIGSAPSAHVRLTDEGIEQQHVELVANATELVLVTVSERGETYVNGDPIKSRTLVDGDRIQLGSRVLLKYRSLPKF